MRREYEMLKKTAKKESNNVTCSIGAIETVDGRGTKGITTCKASLK
jgi:hypothetical protein